MVDHNNHNHKKNGWSLKPQPEVDLYDHNPKKMVDLYNHNQREGNGSTYFQDGARYIGGYTEVLPFTISLII